MNLTINSRLVIPANELKWRFSRASGPGGQGVNKTDSRVELLFDIKQSSVIGPFRKQRLLETLNRNCINGRLRIVVAEERSQYKNRQLALARLACILRQGMKPAPRLRKPTRPTSASKNHRIQAKKKRGILKQQRQRNSLIDD